MRCFIAIDLPQNIKHELNELVVGCKSAEITKPREYHLTMKFLGDVNERELERAKKNLRNVNLLPFVINLDKIGYFPDENSPRIIWTGVTPKRKLVRLKEEIDDALMDLFGRDRKYVPHITLGRVKKILDKNKFKEDFPLKGKGAWKVNCFGLYESRLEEGRHKYYLLEEYK